MKKTIKGALTIEAAYLIPLILLVLAVVVHLLFYNHDKNILLGTMHETAAYGAGLEQAEEGILADYFTERTKGKLLFFTELVSEIKFTDDKVVVKCTARKSSILLKLTCAVNQTAPEDYIRSVRKLIKIGEGKGKQN